MTLKTKIAIEALKTAFAVGGLPPPMRNESRLQGFLETGTTGYRWKLDLIDGDWTVIDTLLGDGPLYEMSVEVDVFFALEGEATDARNTLFDNAVEVIATIFPPNTTLGGAVDSIDISDQVTRDHYILENAPPVEALGFSVSLKITAPTKFG